MTAREQALLELVRECLPYVEYGFGDFVEGSATDILLQKIRTAFADHAAPQIKAENFAMDCEGYPASVSPQAPTAVETLDIPAFLRKWPDTEEPSAAGADWVRVLRVPSNGQLRAMLAAWFYRQQNHHLVEEIPEFVERMKQVYAAANRVSMLSAAPVPDAGENTARQELNAITDYIMGYWPLGMCYVNPIQAIQVMVNRMVKAESALKDARPDAGEGLVDARLAWHRQRGATPGLSCPTAAMCESFDAGWEAARALGRGEGK